MVHSHNSMLLAKHHVLLALLASSLVAIATAQGNGTLTAGQALPQGQALYSKDGRAYLLAQSDGNLVLYSAQVANLFGQSFASAIWASATYNTNTPGPFTLFMTMNCNLVLTNSNGQIIFSSGSSSGNNGGTGACQLVVSGAGFAVVDSTGAAIYSQGAYSTPGTTPGTLPSNAVLTQDTKLFSLDATVFLTAQSDGNLVLYNVALLNRFGASAASAIWDSNTFSNGQHPFRLVMQPDCNLVLYDGSGTAFKDAIYYSATYGQGTPPCALTVSGSGGGFITVSDSAFRVLYAQPPAFEVLLDGGATRDNPPPREQNQIYSVNSGTADLTTTSPSLPETTGRALLPTTNTILAYGFSNGASATPAGAEVFNPMSTTWTRTNPPSTDRLGLGLISLFDGTALAVGGGGPGPNQDSLATCEIYSPATNSWSPAGSLAVARSDVAIAPLQNGNVLTAGGAVMNSTGVNQAAIAEAEVFNVKTRQWAAVSPMANARTLHQMTQLLDGRVLVSGGETAGLQPQASAELFVPASSSFSGTGAMQVGRYLHRATLLPSGKVLVTGGIAVNPLRYPTPPCTLTPSNPCGAFASTNTSELWDPATGAWTAGPTMPQNRQGHDQLLLPNGKVLITGGFGNIEFPNLGNDPGGTSDSPLSFSLLYDETTNTFAATGQLPLTDPNSFYNTIAVLFRK